MGWEGFTGPEGLWLQTPTRKEQLSRPIMMWVSSGIGVGPRLTSDMSFSIWENIGIQISYADFVCTYVYTHMYTYTSAQTDEQMLISIYYYGEINIFKKKKKIKYIRQQMQCTIHVL